MLQIDVDDHGMELRVTAMQNALSDLRPAWPRVHDVFVDFVKHHFSTEGAYVGERWAPLNPGYAAWKERHHPGKGLLHLTERLYPSLTQREHGDHVFITGPDFMEVGTKVPYARAHQHGRPEVNLPARVVLPKPTRNEGERIVDVILAFIFKRMRGRGRGR